MKFKVGDRVEVLTPADGAQPPPKPGPGTITAVSQFEGEYRVKLDSDQTSPDYYYSKDQLRPVPSIHTPSITVGTQVRLTGVVSEIDSDGDIWIKIPDSISGQAFVILSSDKASALEVIRQPFKRGEVVYQPTTFKGGEGAVVVADEANGLMLIAVAEADCTVQEVETKYYERRP